MTSKISRLAHLNKQELLIVSQAVILYPLTAILLRLFGFKNTWRLLGLTNTAKVSTSLSYDIFYIHESIEHVRRVESNLPFLPTCLTRSIVLKRILDAQHIETALVIGVPKDKQGLRNFQAHAWLEYKNMPINDSTDVQFAYARIYSTRTE